MLERFRSFIADAAAAAAQVSGPSINVDEPQQTTRTRKNARNGMAGGEPGRTRLEAPRDGDQHKLSQLFDVLRSKKPDQADQETQVRRITSGRYHESDSDSSSSSDVENRSGHSSPNALSVTESEKDAQVGDVTSSMESSRLSDGTGSPKSLDLHRSGGSNERKQERPVPSPRSPKPAPRKKHSDIVDPDRVVRPKVRQERKSDVKMNGTSARLSVDDTSGVSVSRSLDANISDNHGIDIDRNRRAVSNTEINLQKHVTKTKESLERKQEAFMTESLSDSGMKSHANGDSIFKKTVRKSSDGHEKGDSQVDTEVSEEILVAVRRQPDNESAILMKDSPIFQRKKSDTIPNETNTSITSTDKQPLRMYLQGQEDDIHIHIQRAGSPYSVSMDSLPSSHPSPTFNRGSIGGSSYADSSDTDSLSRFSHPEQGEFSGTESAHPGHEEDYVVEEITKARFQRVSRKVGQVGAATKLTKSPRTIFPGDVELEERETQEASKKVGTNEEGGVVQACQDISDQGKFSLQVQSKSSAKNTKTKTDHMEVKNIKVVETGKEVLMYKDIPKPVTMNVFEISSNEEMSQKCDTNVEENDRQKEVFEAELVEKHVVKPQQQVIQDVKLDETRNKSTAELSWFNEMQETDENCMRHFRPHPRHSSVLSAAERLNSEADSIEGMIDEMVEEGPIRTVDYGRQASGIESDGSFCMTPISPLPPEMFETKQTGTYRLTYISDDNILDSESDESGVRDENTQSDNNEQSKDKQTNQIEKTAYDNVEQLPFEKSNTILESMRSLDKLIYDQGDLVESGNLSLDHEIEEALKTRTSIGTKSNSSSLGSLADIVETETETSTSDYNQEFSENVSCLQTSALESRNKSETAIIRKPSSFNKMDNFQAGANAMKQNSRGKLQPKGSLDILIDDQHEYIQDITENIELDEHFQYLTEKERSAKCLVGQDKDEAEESMSRESSSEVKIEKISFQTTDSAGTGVFGSELHKSNTKTCSNKEKEIVKEKKKVKSFNSLDLLIDSQGDFLDASNQNIDLNEEFVAALEQELDTKDKKYEDEIDIHSDFTYLGIRQSIHDSFGKENLYHQEAGTSECDTSESNEHHKLFREKNNLKQTKPAIRTTKAIPLGFLGQKDSEDCSDSDDLSVIEEEDEADMHLNEVGVDNIDSNDQTLPDCSTIEPDQIKGIVKKQKELFEKQSNSGITESDDNITLDHKTCVKGKIYIKARDLEKNSKTFKSQQASLHAAEKAMGRSTSKLHNKFKRLQDHWVAIEHHEADILDFDDDYSDEDNNNLGPITDKSFLDDSFSEVCETDKKDGEQHHTDEDNNLGPISNKSFPGDSFSEISESDKKDEEKPYTDEGDNNLGPISDKSFHDVSFTKVSLSDKKDGEKHHTDEDDKNLGPISDKSFPDDSFTEVSVSDKKDVEKHHTDEDDNNFSPISDKSFHDVSFTKVSLSDKKDGEKHHTDEDDNNLGPISDKSFHDGSYTEVSVSDEKNGEKHHTDEDDSNLRPISDKSFPGGSFTKVSVSDKKHGEKHHTDEDDNNLGPISDKSFPDGSFTEVSVSDTKEGEKQNLIMEIAKCTPDILLSECTPESISFDQDRTSNSEESLVNLKNQAVEVNLIMEDNDIEKTEKITKPLCGDIENLDIEFAEGHETDINELHRIHSDFSKTPNTVRTEKTVWKEPNEKESWDKPASDKTVGILMTEEKEVIDPDKKQDFKTDTDTIENQDSKTEINIVETLVYLNVSVERDTTNENVFMSEVEKTHVKERDFLKSKETCTEDKTTTHANSSSDVCYSIKDMSVAQKDLGHNTPSYGSLLDIDNDEVSNLDYDNCRKDSGNPGEGQIKLLTVCQSIPERESELTYRLSEDSDVCHSIDEVFVSEIKEHYKIPDNIFQQYQESTRLCSSIPDEYGTIGLDSIDNVEAEVTRPELIQEIKVPITKSEETVDSVLLKADINHSSIRSSEITEVKHIPLKRLTEISKNVTDGDHSQIVKSDQMLKSDHETDLTENLNASHSSSPPYMVDKVNSSSTFKAPGTPPDSIKVRTSSSSIPCSTDLSTSSSFDKGEFFKSERLAGFPETPLTISECSVSQDDSGHVSGGSGGATPEHRRTDSGYSQSSLPSTLSTVTDRSEEEEDIDKIVANIHSKAGNRGNLLTVTSESRESIASYYSDAGDIAYSTVPVTGEVLFGVNYNYKTGMLEITVKQCKNIAVADTKRNRSDPYVKTYLLPDRTRGGKRKTKIKKHTVNPTFDETLKYSISKSELENRTLWLTLWHSDRFGRNIFLGEVTINFDYYKFDDPSPKWYQLQERMDNQPSSMMVYKGDLSLCVRYVPADKIKPAHSKGKQKKESTKGQLEVIVKEARNLTAVRSNGFSDPFCKGYLLPERHKSSKQKTAVIKKDCNPIWNHTMVFEDVSLMELRERCLELTIWDYEKLSSNDFLGGVRLNLGTGVSQGKQVDWMDARGEEMSMWQAMLDRPNLWIDGALILRPNMEKRKY